MGAGRKQVCCSPMHPFDTKCQGPVLVKQRDKMGDT